MEHLLQIFRSIDNEAFFIVTHSFLFLQLNIGEQSCNQQVNWMELGDYSNAVSLFLTQRHRVFTADVYLRCKKIKDFQQGIAITFFCLKNDDDFRTRAVLLIQDFVHFG